jgi:ABC-type phosphate/phosphonate transport system substrate-binding protein
MLVAAGLVLALSEAGTGRASAADPPNSNGVQIGMIQGMFRDVQPGMVQAMARPLRDLILKQTGLTGDVEVVADAFALSDRMKATRYHIGVFHGFEYAWVRKQHPNLLPLAVTVPPGRKFQACVVVHKDCPAKSLADLKDEQVTVPRGTKAHCLLFFDRERAGLSATTAKPKTKPLVTTEDALNAVVEGESPAALVDAAGLLGYKTIQPGAFKHLRILTQSESFPQTVVVFNKGSLTDDAAGKIRRLLTDAHASPAGKPLLAFWNLKGFEDVPADYGAQLDAISKAYPAPPAARPGVTPTVGMSDEK